MAGCKPEPQEPPYEVFNDNAYTIASDGVTRFSIVYCEKESEADWDLKDAVEKLRTIIADKTGTQIPAEVRQALLYEEDMYEIYIGDTTFPESEEARAPLMFNDYVIKRSGKKIVITGSSVKSTIKAVEAFCTALEETTFERDKYLEFNKTMEAALTGEYTVGKMVINGNDMKDYAIVLDENCSTIEEELAHVIRQEIANKYGHFLEIEDKGKETGKAIYIGKATGMLDSMELVNYSLAIKDSNVYIAAGSTYAYDEAYEKLCEKLFTGSEFVFEGEWEVNEDLTEKFEKENNAILGKTGELRIIDHNVYGNDRTPTINPTRRYRIQRDIYNEFDADILIFQEFKEKAYNLVSGYIKKFGYVQGKVETGAMPLYTPFFYKSDVLTALETGYHQYTYVYPEDTRIAPAATKSVIWAVMEVNQTGKRFILMNTHLYYNADKESADGVEYETDDIRYLAGSLAGRLDNIRELKQVLETVKSVPEYANLPVILGGDLNSAYRDLEFTATKELYDGRIALTELEEYGFKSAQRTSPVTDLRNTTCGYPKYDKYYEYYYSIGSATKAKLERAIDHIYYMGDIEPVFFDIIDPTFIRKTSDHLPLCFDFNLG